VFTIDHSAFTTLTTDRLVLRELRPSDVAQVFALRSDPLVMQHVNRALARSTEDASELIELINSRTREKEAVHWAITVKGEDELIGLIGFWRLVKEHHYGELGYTLAREHWGQGYATEAIRAALHYGFRTLGFHRAEAITRPQNTASIRALEKNGFVREGHFRENIFWNGSFHDSLVFGKLAP
jgi:ribosomal-protein-alanine N-acetyltransferase